MHNGENNHITGVWGQEIPPTPVWKEIHLITDHLPLTIILGPMEWYSLTGCCPTSTMGYYHVIP